MNYPFRNIRTSYDVLKLTKKLNIELKNAQELFISQLKQFAYTDEKGNILPNEGKPDTYKIKEDLIPEWEKNFKEFNSMEHELGVYKLTLQDLDGLTLSANDLSQLESIIVVEEEPASKENLN